MCPVPRRMPDRPIGCMRLEATSVGNPSCSPYGELCRRSERCYVRWLEHHGLRRQLRRARRHNQRTARPQQLRHGRVGVADIRSVQCGRRTGRRVRRFCDGVGRRWHADEGIQLRRCRPRSAVSPAVRAGVPAGGLFFSARPATALRTRRLLVLLTRARPLLLVRVVGR